MSNTDESTRQRSRRDWLAGTAAFAGAAAFAGRAGAAEAATSGVVKHGRIKQSVVPWCFKPMPPEELIELSAQLGLRSVELISPEYWPLLKKHNMVCALTGSHGFARGLADPKEHEYCLTKLRESIDVTAAAGFPGVITFSGIATHIDKEEGIDHMVAGIKQIIGHAEKQGVTLCVEVLNSRVDVNMKGHPGYLCDTVEWAAKLCDRVGSERMKMLFDIYHVQIMQGDLITRIRQYKDYIGHYHTAGVPGRNEIDDTQEINYPAVMRAIVETGYQGYVGQEFIPVNDKAESLRQSVLICDV